MLKIQRKVDYNDKDKDMNSFLLAKKFKNKSSNTFKCSNKYKTTIINKLAYINLTNYLMMDFSKHLKHIANPLLDSKIKTLRLTTIMEITRIACHFIMVTLSLSLTRKRGNTSR
jgi:hypothetical protein